MRAIPAQVISTYPGTRTISASLSYDRPRADFITRVLQDSLGQSDPSRFVDMCASGDDMIRVCNVDDVLHTQLVAGFETFTPWVNTSISLFHDSRPGVDISDVGIRIWFQDVGGTVCYIDYPSLAVTPMAFFSSAATCAPVGNGCYVQTLNQWLSICYLDGTEKIDWLGKIYGDLQSPNFLDAVRIGSTDYIFTMDRNAGRTLELRRIGAQWTSPVQVLPLDIVDNTSGFILSYASAFSGKVYLTGRMIRSNDVSPIQMDIVAVGPAPYSFGRYKFLSDTEIGGKIFLIGQLVRYVGLGMSLRTASTEMYGVISEDNAWPSATESVSLDLTDSESGGSQAVIVVPEYENVTEADNVYVDLTIDETVIRIGSYGVKEIAASTAGDGSVKTISGVGKALAILERWYPFQSIYMASQVAMSSHAGALDQVLRAKGTYSMTSGPLVLDSINDYGILYSVGRASKSTVSRAKFISPSSSILFPRYGVGVNYTRNAPIVAVGEAAPTENAYLHNGIVAICEKDESDSTTSVSIYTVTESVFYRLISVPISIPADAWHWLQMRFVDGRITVSYRLDADIPWIVLIDTVYEELARSPWASIDTPGRGFIYLENGTKHTTTTGFLTTDTVIPVADTTPFGPSQKVIVDSEIIECLEPSANIHVIPNKNFADMVSLESPSTEFTGFPVIIHGVDHNNADNFCVGACLSVTAGPGAGRVFQITGYDAHGPRSWTTTWLHDPILDDWHDYIGIDTGDTHLYEGRMYPGHGFWSNNKYRVVYVDADPETSLGTGSVLSISPGLKISLRGQMGTAITTHTATNVSLYTSDKVGVDLFQTFTGDEDISIADAFTRLFAMAGAPAPSFKNVLENPTLTPWKSSQWATERRNFIADMTIPTIPLGEAIGFSFRNEEVPTAAWASGPKTYSGYMVLLRNSYVGIYDLELWMAVRPLFWLGYPTSFVLVESQRLTFSPSGTMRISVQDNVFSVWINSELIHAFVDETYTEGDAYSAIASYSVSPTVTSAELCERLPDLPIDTQSNGWNALSTIIAQRHIYFSDLANGSIFCYQKRTSRGNAPNIVIDHLKTSTDTRMTRVRAEGIKIAEYMNFDDVRKYGDIGLPVNAAYANSPGEVTREAKLIQSMSIKEAIRHRLTTTLFPGITSGDIWNFTLPSGLQSVEILSTSMQLSISQNEVSFGMSIDGISGSSPTRVVDGGIFVVQVLETIVSGGTMQRTGTSILSGGDW